MLSFTFMTNSWVNFAQRLQKISTKNGVKGQRDSEAHVYNPSVDTFSYAKGYLLIVQLWAFIELNSFNSNEHSHGDKKFKLLHITWSALVCTREMDIIEFNLKTKKVNKIVCQALV